MASAIGANDGTKTFYGRGLQFRDVTKTANTLVKTDYPLPLNIVAGNDNRGYSK